MRVVVYGQQCVETFDEQTGADEEHEGECYFGDDQGTAEAMARVKQKAPVSRRMVFHPAMNLATSGGMCWSIRASSQCARNSPRAAPTMESRTLSTSN